MSITHRYTPTSGLTRLRVRDNYGPAKPVGAGGGGGTNWTVNDIIDGQHGVGDEVDVNHPNGDYIIKRIHDTSSTATTNTDVGIHSIASIGASSVRYTYNYTVPSTWKSAKIQVYAMTDVAASGNFGLPVQTVELFGSAQLAFSAIAFASDTSAGGDNTIIASSSYTVGVQPTSFSAPSNPPVTILWNDIIGSTYATSVNACSGATTANFLAAAGIQGTTHIILPGLNFSAYIESFRFTSSTQVTLTIVSLPSGLSHVAGGNTFTPSDTTAVPNIVVLSKIPV